MELQSSLIVRFLISSESFSLLSKVGGFLGLLLGVSILTVCEILDFIVVAAAAEWKEKKSRGQVTQSETADLDEKQPPGADSTISIIEILEKEPDLKV